MSGLSFGSLDAHLSPLVKSTGYEQPSIQSAPTMKGRSGQGSGSVKKARLRVMDRIYRHGDSPENVHGEGFNGLNLVEVAAKQFPGSDTDYNSSLWDVLSGSKLPDKETRENLVGNTLGRMSFVQSPPWIAEFATFVCGPNYPGRPGDLQFIESGAALLAQECSLDAVMVLAIEARDAIDRLSLIEGQTYIDALKACCEGYDVRIKAGMFSGMVHAVALRKIVRGDWTPIQPVHWPNYKTLLRKEVREDVKKNPAFYTALREEFGPFAETAVKVQQGVPIVLYDRRMDFLNGALVEIFEVAKAAFQNGKGAVFTMRELLVMAPSPLLEKAANLWPNPIVSEEEQAPLIDV